MVCVPLNRRLQIWRIWSQEPASPVQPISRTFYNRSKVSCAAVLHPRKLPTSKNLQVTEVGTHEIWAKMLASANSLVSIIVTTFYLAITAETKHTKGFCMLTLSGGGLKMSCKSSRVPPLETVSGISDIQYYPKLWKKLCRESSKTSLYFRF